MSSCKLEGVNGDASVRGIPAVPIQVESKRSGISLTSGSLLGGGTASAVSSEPCAVCEEIEIVATCSLSDSDAASVAGSSFFLGPYLSPVLEIHDRNDMHEMHVYARTHIRKVSGVGGISGGIAVPSMASYGSLGGHTRNVSRSGVGNLGHRRVGSVGSLGYTCHSRNTSVGSLAESAADSMAELVTRSGKENEGDFRFW